MQIKRFLLVCGTLFALNVEAQEVQVPVSEAHEKMATGKYQPTWQSLRQHKVPEWFRNAKFGIWAHWGPQCVEGTGDWMARSMYMEGSREYKHHVEHYGHPSEFGFKDLLPLFKAENWDPDKLVEKYKKVGAQYFFVLGNHHDNFDLWDSKYQPWNAKNMGPRRDVVGEWAQAARKHGLPFGISFHADHAWTWYEPAQRYDQRGPKAGVYYDGKMTKADGKGKWWEGLDPQDLYQQDHPMSDRSWNNGQIHSQWGWSNGAALPSQKFVTNFYDRCLDAINRYNPDLIYFDVTVIPFHQISDTGLKIAAHFYNHNAQTHKGKETSVMFGKILNEEQRKAITWDVERGAPNQIIDEPWQTCNCIGGWHYNTSIYENDGYKSAATVVKQLVDIVSKNGNLLLSIPLRADGTYDDKEAKVLDELGEWMQVNKESIIGTRPWKLFGEGPVAEANIKLNAQGFNDGMYGNMTWKDIRFNQTSKYLYATAMGWPESGQLIIKSLAKGKSGLTRKINAVELLGYGRIKTQQTSKGLVVNLPKPVNSIAPVLKIKK
ncbi:alpha-L-fucosidase [Hallella bergensis]|uniref:alpha-L-fucosidase n=1 Tax=Hallella bergensis TaxID=242750 RepID=UPI0023F2D957|nr:alpha-L-fucosidase [Hallella bergensis]